MRDVKSYETQQIIDKIVRYVGSPEGQKEIARRTAETKKTIEELRKAEVVDISLLLEPVDF